MEILETAPRDGVTQKKVRLPMAAGKTIDGYLLLPAGKGPFPAVLVVYYDAETGAGLKPKDESRAFGWHLARRGFVTLSVGWPRDFTNAQSPTMQPLSTLAYVAANCHSALAALPEVDARRIGVVGHSFGGKWAMFAACLDDRFACAAWSDPGIVFDEKRPNVNYWEPWYLGWEKDRTRKPGVPSDANPRTGPYKRLYRERPRPARIARADGPAAVARLRRRRRPARTLEGAQPRRGRQPPAGARQPRGHDEPAGPRRPRKSRTSRCTCSSSTS